MYAIRSYYERALAGRAPFHVVRQDDRELILRHRHLAVFRAVDDGDRRAPVALAGDEPVAQAEVDGAAAEALFLGMGGHGLDRLAVVHSRKFAGIDAGAVFGVGILHLLQHQRAFRILDGELDGQVVLFRKGDVITSYSIHYTKLYDQDS